MFQLSEIKDTSRINNGDVFKLQERKDKIKNEKWNYKLAAMEVKHGPLVRKMEGGLRMQKWALCDIQIVICF